MLHCRTLSIEEHKELQEFLKLHKLELNVRTRRDLTDVVPVAKIFKKVHPKLVDMHNYTPRNSLALKLQNWQTFNSKVLRKLGLNLTKSALEQLANGSAGAIESLLYDLMAMNKETLQPISRSRSLKLTPQSTPQDSPPQLVDHRPTSISLTHVPKQALVEKLPPEVLTLDVKEMVNGKMVKVPKSVVAYEDYQDALRECHEKDTYITSVSQKAEYLESVIRTKQDRITELTEQLGRLSVSILSMRPKISNNDDNDDGDYDIMNIRKGIKSPSITMSKNRCYSEPS